jgi:hypothetical protein
MCRTLSAIALAYLLFGCSKKKDSGTQPEPDQIDPSKIQLGQPGPGKGDPGKGTPGGGNPPKAEVPKAESLKAEFTVTAEAYFKELTVNAKATREKYAGKVFDITTTFFNVVPSNTYWLAEIENGLNPVTKHPIIQGVFLTAPDSGREKDLRLLSSGQKVTVRVKGVVGPVGSEFSYAAIADSGPSPAKVTTLAEVEPGLKAAQQKGRYETPEVLVRARVVEVTDGGLTACVVTDPDVANGPRFGLKATAFTGYRKELEGLKLGDVVFVLGSPRLDFDEPILDNARIVKEPPAGLKLPVAKK